MDPHDLYQEGMDSAGIPSVVIENFLFMAQIASGAWLMSSFTALRIPYISISYVAFAVYMLLFYLRKHICTGCFYYGKQCHCGWGKVAAALYKKEAGNYQLGGKAATITWPLLMLLPIIVHMLAVVVLGISFTQRLPLLGFFILVAALNMGLHFVDCRRCKMRYICPGSAAKKR